MGLCEQCVGAGSFQNGSFELGNNPNQDLPGGSTAITGWVVTGSLIAWVGGDGAGGGPENGSFFVDLNGCAGPESRTCIEQGGIQQTFETTAGETYAATFYLRSNDDPYFGPPVSNLVGVTAAGVSETFSTPTSGWEPFTFRFTATASATTLAFVSLSAGTAGPELDNVQVARPQPLQFYSVTPCRVADTRTGSGFTGAFGPPSMAAGAQRSFPIPSSSCGIPATAAAYSLNFTVVPTGILGYLSTWPTGQPMPVVSTLNSPMGTVVANAAIVPAGTSGAINVFVTNPTDVLFDINGYFAPPLPSGLQFYPVTPCRVADTRTGSGFTGAFGPPSMAAGAQRSFPIPSSSCGIPATAAAYSLNFTVVPTGILGYLSTWPTGQPMPVVSTLNSPMGTVVANAAIVPAGTSGAINVFVTNPTDVLFDINGYFAPPLPSGLQFYPVTPCRVADTRTGSGFTGAFGPPSMAAGAQRSFPIPSSSCGIPATAAAYSLNFTVVPTGILGYLSTWPTGQPMPVVSTLNSPMGYRGSECGYCTRWHEWRDQRFRDQSDRCAV